MTTRPLAAGRSAGPCSPNPRSSTTATDLAGALLRASRRCRSPRTATTIGQTIEEKNHKRLLRVSQLPLLIAACLICVIGSINLYRLTSATAPRNPWEAVEVLEAWRSLRGMPVYELPPDGHSTHMYGALVPWVQGEIFRWTGPNNVTGRLLSVVSALFLAALLGFCFVGERSAWALTVAWAAFLGLDHRSGHYFAENRPDMPALFLGAGAVVLFGLGIERRRWPLVVLGTACLVLGFFFKQTVAIFSAVPLIALFMRWRRPDRSEVVLAGIPLVVMASVILSLGFLSPAVHHFMIVVPSAYGINWLRAAKFFWELMLDSPLFLVLLAELVFFGEGLRRDDTRGRWLLAALAIAVPFSVIACAKTGGSSNCLLPAFFPMMAFCVLRLPRMVKRIEGGSRSVPKRLALGSFLAVLLLMTTFPHLTPEQGLIVPSSRWDRDYRETLAVAGRLPGTVVCPEDPTIPFYGRGYVGLCLFSEKDARAVRGEWPVDMPELVLDEMRNADFIVDVREYWGGNVDDALLESLGFQAMDVQSIDPGCYQIWRKTNRPMTSVSPTFLDQVGQSDRKQRPVR
jgi:hypothetical protein